MAQSMILAEFDKLVRTPGDVDRLNEAILELAVRGKLVPQDPADEPASSLPARIRAEKQRLEVAGEIRASKPLPRFKAEEMAFALPEGWVWVRLSDVTHDWGQTKPSERFCYVDVSSIDNRLGRISDSVQVLDAAEAPSRARKIVRRNTVIYSTVRPYLLNIAVVDREFDFPPIVSTAFFVMHPLPGLDERFLFYYLRSRPFVSFVESQMVGMAYPAISDSKMQLGLLPLPPLAEQQHIVAAVESLLARTAALKESLAAAQTERETLTAAALHRLETAADPAQSAAAWALIRENFAALIATPQSVAALKQTILQLAVQGKLVPQNPADEPASALLARIRAEKKRLEEAGELRSSKPLAKVTAAEMPFALPDGWVWCRLGEIASDVDYGTSQKASSDPNGVPILRMNNIQNGEIDFDSLKYVPKTLSDLPRLYLRKNDLLFNRTNSYELVGKTGIFRNGDNVFTFASYLIRLRVLESFINADYVNDFLNSPECRRSQIEPEITQQTNQANFNGTKLQHICFPLPPLAEQQRIVARVDALFALCDGLAAGLADGEALRARWVAALLAGTA